MPSLSRSAHRALLERQRVDHDTKRCFFVFMYECYGFADRVYPSDVLTDWSWTYVDASGAAFSGDPLSAAGVRVSSPVGNKSMTVMFDNLKDYPYDRCC